MEYTALIVAAGSGSRMGLGYNKMLYKLSNGKTILETTIAIFQNDQRCKQLIIVGSEHDQETYQNLLSNIEHIFIVGGNTRQESVEHGLRQVSQPYVFIHDGARPWVNKECIDRLVHSVELHQACLLMVPVKDTIKEVKDGIIRQTYDRSKLYQAQTPQVFAYELIYECHQQAKKLGIEATDDAQLVELCSSNDVYMVEGSYENRKVTTMDDLYEVNK